MRLLVLMALILVPSLVLALPFDHFVTDTSGSYTQGNDAVAPTFSWNPGGSSVTVTCVTCSDGWMIRNSSTANDSTVWARAKSSATGSPWGVISNHVDGTHYYMMYMSNTDNTVKLYLKNATYSVLSSVGFTQMANQNYVAKMTSTVNGANQDLVAYVDGVSITSASTSTKHGTGGWGFQANPSVSGRTITFDWVTANNALAFISMSPTSGPVAGGTPVTIVTTDAGPGVLVQIGGASATSVVGNTAGTTVTCTTPAGTAGAQAVRLYEGTAAAEEFDRTQASAYTYIGLPAGGLKMMGTGK